MEGLYLLIPFLLFIGVALWLSHRNLDYNTIRSAIERRGGTLIQVKWSMFAGGDDGRLYRVRYWDRDGGERETICKASAGDTSFSDERLIRPAKGSGPEAKR